MSGHSCKDCSEDHVEELAELRRQLAAHHSSAEVYCTKLRAEFDSREVTLRTEVKRLEQAIQNEISDNATKISNFCRAIGVSIWTPGPWYDAALAKHIAVVAERDALQQFKEWAEAQLEADRESLDRLAKRVASDES